MSEDVITDFNECWRTEAEINPDLDLSMEEHIAIRREERKLLEAIAMENQKRMEEMR